MALFRKLFYRKPPDGLLEISERVYVFDCCFTAESWEDKNIKEYIGSIIAQLKESFPDPSFLVFDFWQMERENLMSKTLSEYDMTIMDYPCQYQGCPLLTMELVNHFLRSTESWLELGPENVLLMHCERGGWAVLAFMLTALLLYRKQYTGEDRTLDMVYKQAPNELLPYHYSLNPVPSQIRYLKYVSRRNVASQWPPSDTPFILDCIIIRLIPNFDRDGGCRPLFRIYGQDPLDVTDRTSKLLFSTTKNSKAVRLYKQAESKIVKIDINCNIQGDIVLECFHLDDCTEREETMFRVMFNTAFIRSNILMLNRDDVDTLWHTKDYFPKDFSAEILFSDIDSVDSVVAAISSCFEEKEGLPVEAFAKVQEFFSHVDWLDSRADAALSVLQKITESHSPEKSDEAGEEGGTLKCKSSPPSVKEEQKHTSVCSDCGEKKFIQLQSPSSDPNKREEKVEQHEAKALEQPNEPFHAVEDLRDSSQSVKDIGQHVEKHSHSSSDKKTIDGKAVSDSHLLSDDHSKSSFPTPSSTPPHSPRQSSSTKSTKEISTSSPSSPSSLSLLPHHLVGAEAVDSKAIAQDTSTSSTSTPPLESLGSQPLPPPSPSPSPPPPPPSSMTETSQSKSQPPPAAPSSSSTLSSTPSDLKAGSPPPPAAPPPPPPSVSSLKDSTESGPSTSSAPPPPPPPSAPPPPPAPNAPSAPSAPPPPPAPNAPSAPSAPPPPSLNKPGSASIPEPPSNAKIRGPLRTLALKNPQTKKLKPLHWMKLNRAVKGSLWAEAQKTGEAPVAPEIDMSELESLFSAAVPNANRGASGGKSGNATAQPKSEKVQLIDNRRACNCEIMLSKVKVPIEELTNVVLALEESAMDPDQVENLIKFCPTKEEMELLKGYKGERDKLGKCEQFFLTLMEVPRVEAKLRVFSFKLEFRTQVTDLRRSLDVVSSAAYQIRTSAKLKKVMQTVLSLGNALNQGTARGSAVGFRLDSLLKLNETRARNNKMTLMHYLCKVISEKLPELLDFSEDLTSVEPASKVQIKFLAEEMQSISKRLEKVLQELSASESDGSIADAFRKNLKEFVSHAEAEVKSLSLLYSGVGKKVDALITYFGEDPARCSFEQVVSTLHNFTTTFNQSHEQNCKQLELEKKKAETENQENLK